MADKKNFRLPCGGELHFHVELYGSLLFVFFHHKGDFSDPDHVDIITVCLRGLLSKRGKQFGLQMGVS